MKKLSALILIPILVFALSSKSYSQPQFTIHVTGGYNLPLPDLKGDLTSAADSNTYNMKLGFGFGADGKYYLGKKRNVGITLSAGYQLFSNSEDTANNMKNPKYKLNAFTVGLGVDYAFLPKGKANPFIGVEFTGHFFSGNKEWDSLGTSKKIDLASASRFGIAGGFGVDISLSKSIGIVIGGKYHLANLIGKDYDSTQSATEYSLNDKEYTKGTTTYSAKNISYLQFYAGISFFLNQPKKMKR